jgi:uncharacterized tellurite resistance protein B-like protein
MFTNVLLDSEKEAFIKLLFYLARIDGELSQGELSLIQQHAIDLGVDSSQFFGDNTIILNLEEILKEVTHPVSKNAIMLELINLAYADKSYTDNERRGIRYIGGLLGVKEEKLCEIEQWVQEGIVWADKGLTIITTEETTNGTWRSYQSA